MLDWGIADNATPPHVFLMNGEDKLLSLPLTDANEAKVRRLAAGAEFVIRSDSERGFWSNEMGWVYDVNDATRYDVYGLYLRLPLAQGNDAEWDVLQYAE